MTLLIATVNMERVLSETVEGRRRLEEIRVREDAKKLEYEQLEREVYSLMARYQEHAAEMAEDDLRALKQLINDKRIEAEHMRESTIAELERKHIESIGEFERLVFPMFDHHCKQTGISLLIPFPQRWLVFAAPALDVTDTLIRLVDESAAASGTGPGGA